jgi:NADPH-dependent curcumin reductase CurA
LEAVRQVNRQILLKKRPVGVPSAGDFARRYDEARADLARWIREGKIRYRDDIVEGLDQAPSHLLRLFSGEHRGKLMVKLADPEV